MHQKNPRAFGVEFRQLLASQHESQNFESILKNGIRLNVLLDRLSFPSQDPGDPAKEGWPPHKYFPDGFSLLSYSPDTNRPTDSPLGEKLRIDKLDLISGLPEENFQKLAKDISTYVASLPQNSAGRTELTQESVRELYQKISTFLYDTFSLPDKQDDIEPLESQSVRLGEYVKKPSRAMCRHYELVSQVLLQQFGLPGEILNCHMYLRENLRGNHLMTLLKTDKSSYIVDFTNPDYDGKVFFERINDVDPQSVNKVLWDGDRRLRPGKLMNVKYLTKQTSSPVYYRILHGWNTTKK